MSEIWRGFNGKARTQIQTLCVTPCVILQQVVAPLGSRLEPGQSSGTGAPKVPPWSGQGTAGEGSISSIKNPAYSTPSAPWPRDPFTGGSCASMGLLMSALPKAAGIGLFKSGHGSTQQLDQAVAHVTSRVAPCRARRGCGCGIGLVGSNVASVAVGSSGRNHVTPHAALAPPEPEQPALKMF